jgi:hypothetical protein
MQDLADGYPDPQTGKCTALSAAFNIRVVPAFIEHGAEPSGIVKPVTTQLASNAEVRR